MSTSSQGADSTPSANSVLSDSILLQSADSLPEANASSPTSATVAPQPSSGLKKNETMIMLRPTSEAEWQARCIELELALQKFRDQAHNIRKLLRDKVSQTTKQDFDLILQFSIFRQFDKIVAFIFDLFVKSFIIPQLIG